MLVTFGGLFSLRSTFKSKKLAMLTTCLKFPESHNSQFSKPTEIRGMSDNARQKITKTPAEHPKYEIIKIAIRTVKDRDCSRQVIEK